MPDSTIPQPTTAGAPDVVIDCEEPVQYINSFRVSSAGTWLLSVTSRGLDGIHRVYVRRSSDRGRTWSPRIPAYDANAELGEDYNCEMGQIIEERGRLYQFHIKRRLSNSVRFGKLVYSVSDDDGRSWHGPDGANTVFPVEVPIYDIAGHEWGWHLMAPPYRTSDGIVILPMNCCTDPPLLDDIECEPVYAHVHGLRSRDPGAVKLELFPPPPHGLHVPYHARPGKSHGMEAQVTELSDGRLFSVIRTANGVVSFTLSRDSGRTWSDPQPLRRDDGGEPILNPNCPNPLTRLSDGRYAVLHCNNDGNAFGASSVFAHTIVRHPIYVSVGRENRVTANQPIRWSEPRLMTTLDGYEPKFGAPMGDDLTYGLLHEEEGRYYHFYNARWESIQMNEIPAGVLEV